MPGELKGQCVGGGEAAVQRQLARRKRVLRGVVTQDRRPAAEVPRGGVLHPQGEARRRHEDEHRHVGGETRCGIHVAHSILLRMDPQPEAPLGYIHRFEPAAGSTRTLLLLHGTGGDENDLLPLGAMLDTRAARLSPRGQVLEHGTPRFFRRIAEGVFDLEDLARRTNQLADFIESAARAYGLKRDRIYAAGFSNGANIAASVLLLRPGALAGALLFSPMLPFEPARTPDLAGVSVWIATGRADRIAPPEQAERLATLLRACGAEVEMHAGSDGHGIERGAIEAARAWLARR